MLLVVPLSAVACLLMTDIGGGSINTMVLGGLALAFSRLIDNSVVVLENIFRHMEMGEPPRIAAERGGKEVALAVLAATVTTSIVFFPVALLTGVSKYLFTPLALGVVLSHVCLLLFAMTVVPLFYRDLHSRAHIPARRNTAALPCNSWSASSTSISLA